MRFFVMRTTQTDSQPCAGAYRVDLAVKEWWIMNLDPIGSKAINRKSVRHDGHLQLWAIDVNSLDELLPIMALNSKRNNEIIVGSSAIDGQVHHYIEIYNDYRE